MKRELQEGDYVYLPPEEDGIRRIGYIEDIMGDMAEVSQEDDGDWFTIALKELEYIPPKEIPVEELHRFLRLEMSAEDLEDGAIPWGNWEVNEKCPVQLEDLEAALGEVLRMVEAGEDPVSVIQWSQLLTCRCEEYYLLPTAPEGEDSLLVRYLPRTEEAMVLAIWHRLESLAVEWDYPVLMETEEDAAPEEDAEEEDVAEEENNAAEEDVAAEEDAAAAEEDDAEEEDAATAETERECQDVLPFGEEVDPALIWDLSPWMEDVRTLLRDIGNFRRRENVFAWRWSSSDTGLFISELKDRHLEQLDLAVLEAVREDADRLCKEDPEIMEWVGYSYYGGNPAYPCDWVKSRDIFLRLMEMDTVDDRKKCCYGNTLGYIYYYGRCNDGVPEYEEALRCFSIGAAGGYYESIYKLSDLYLHGYGTPKNVLAAQNYINFIWPENLKAIRKEEFNCKFADVALRMGNLCRDGNMAGDAYYYYTLADFAIRKRLQYRHFGDANVFTGIQKELDRIRQERPLKEDREFCRREPVWICEALEGHACRFHLEPCEEGLSVTAKRLPHPGEEKPEKFFLCIPDAGICELQDEITEIALPPRSASKETASEGMQMTAGQSEGTMGKGTSSEDSLLQGSRDFIADECRMHWQDGKSFCVFLHHGEQVASLEAGAFLLRCDREAKPAAEKCSMVSVRFTPHGRAYDYLTGELRPKVGDRVVVFTNGEEQIVEVVRAFEMDMGELPLEISRYKSILRIV